LDRIRGGNEANEPIDKAIFGMAGHRAATKVNASVDSKTETPEAEPAPKGRRQHGSPQLIEAVRNSGGCWRQHDDKEALRNWRSPPRPGEKSAEQEVV
jgi:hypothetical protein